MIERGWVYFRLNQYGKAIEDFNKALELDPEDENAARGLLASERQISLTEAINKLKKETKSDVDTLIGNADKLEKREKKAKDSICWLNFLIFLARAVIVFLFFCHIIWPVLDNPPSCDQTCILKNLLHFPTLLMLIFPFIWGIRILMAAKEKQQILREDYYRRRLIDATLRHVFDPLTPSDDTPGLKKQNRKVWAKYISRWSEHSPAEMMLQYRSKDKGSASSNAHPTEIVFNQCKEAVTKKPDGSA